MQHFKLLGRCAKVKTELAFFQEQRERFTVDSIVFAQYAFCLIPKVFNAVDMVLSVGKQLAVINAVVGKSAYIQHIIAAQTIRIDNAVWHNFLCDNRK